MNKHHGKGGSPGGDPESPVMRILPNNYIHVLDQNTNVTRVICGPTTTVRQDHERVVDGPVKMVIIPPRNYCVIDNPCEKDASGNVILDKFGQVKLRHGDTDIRLTQEPFPLYPGETMKMSVTPLRVVAANCALRITAILDFDHTAKEVGSDGKVNSVKRQRIAGDEWLFEGPGTYIPRKEEKVLEDIRAVTCHANQAIRLRARKETVDRDGNDRVTGEEWLHKKTGAYLPGPYEEFLEIVNAYVLTERKALHMKSLRTFTDSFGVVRKCGDEWLIKMADSETHIPNIYEEVVGEVRITTLNSRQYCVILDPVDEKTGRNQLGKKKLIQGPANFFLMPGEKLEKGIQNVYVLSEEDGLVISCIEPFKERSPGDRWMIRGPVEYTPPVEVEVLSRRRAVPLDENEGIYVRDIRTGKVRAIIGQTYMLNETEELWEKDLPDEVEGLLSSAKDPIADRLHHGAKEPTTVRNKTKVVTYRVPHNAAVQIYDYKEKKSRVIYGPELVMLGPDEQFTRLSLSGGKPKKPGQIQALCLVLGPDFCTDIVIVETSDHARLQLQLSYNWHFEVSGDADSKIFAVPDFVGDLCKAIASRVRGAVAQCRFDDFHRHSAKIIRQAVFGMDENQKVKARLTFPQNNLTVTNVDIQSVEPVDQRTRDSLMKSVQLAIEITTNSQEAAARHEAERLEQEARGRLERQKIEDEAEAEKSKEKLLQLQALSAAIESTGQAKAEAQSRAESSLIEGQAAVDQAKLRAQAAKIEADAELERLTAARDAELAFIKEQNNVEIEKSQKSADIETGKFKQIVDAIGANTIQSMAQAGPDMQVKLLQSLGLQTTLITDGNAPINLFNTAQGLIGSLSPALKDATS